MAWISLCEITELTENQGKYVEIDGNQLAVFLSDGKVSVLDNHCPHAGGNLAGGHVEDGCAVCPWHYWAFRLDSTSSTTRSSTPGWSSTTRLSTRRRLVTRVLPEVVQALADFAVPQAAGVADADQSPVFESQERDRLVRLGMRPEPQPVRFAVLAYTA